jgi:EAL domain-containing protein (putative c-di-GMP-specific phosphodiesterase class I)/ActR/RegA family two-component response regulator
MSTQPARDRLLVIDDDDAFRRVVTRIAEAADYEVMTASDPTVSRAIVASWRPAVVVIDLSMPATDGVQLLRQLGAEACPAQVILTSGLSGSVLSSALDVAGEYGLKTAGILPKPFRPDTCRELLFQIKSTKQLTLTELAEAIASSQLFLEYQPKLDCRFDRITGVEALVRWQHPTRGMVPPDQFIGLAEETALIDELTDWVFSTATKQVAMWRDAGLSLKLAVNISARNLDRVDLADRLAERCAASGLETGSATLEIAEGSAMRHVAQMIKGLTRLRSKGFGLSIDEFGTGYMSLVELRRMPLTEIKVDRAFVSAMMHDRDCHIMAEIIIDLARKLELGSVAVGVESEITLNTLKAMGCGSVQGYLISRPVAPDRIPAAIDEWASRSERGAA